MLVYPGKPITYMFIAHSYNTNNNVSYLFQLPKVKKSSIKLMFLNLNMLIFEKGINISNKYWLLRSLSHLIQVFTKKTITKGYKWKDQKYKDGFLNLCKITCQPAQLMYTLDQSASFLCVYLMEKNYSNHRLI